MARILDSYTFASKGRQGRYDWPSLLDGRIHELTKGDDFDCKPESVRNGARQAATAHGKGIRTAVTGDTVVIQAFELPAEPVTAE